MKNIWQSLGQTSLTTTLFWILKYPWRHIAQHYLIIEDSKLLLKAPHSQGKVPGVVNITASDAVISHMQQSVARCYGIHGGTQGFKLLMSDWDDCERDISSWQMVTEQGWASHHYSGTTFGRDCSKHLWLLRGLKHSAATHQERDSTLWQSNYLSVVCSSHCSVL